jgi:hypothetical protein
MIQVAGGDSDANTHLLQLLAMPTDGCKGTTCKFCCYVIALQSLCKVS